MRLATELHDENEHSLNHRTEETPARQKQFHEIPAVPNGAAQSLEYSALAARATNDALRIWDVTSGRLTWPQGLESLLGYEPSAIRGDIGFWQKHIHPDDRPRIAAEIRDALAQSEHWSGEYRFRRADGAYLLLLERAWIVRNENAQAVRFIGSLMDITARKQLQDQLCRSQKMEAFGQLAAGVAHDFNNFLTTILGYSDLLLNDTSLKGRVAKHVSEIRRAAGRASALTEQLATFSRRRALDPRVLEVNRLIADLERDVLRLVGENIVVQCELHPFENGDGYSRVDPGQLTQIILNLIVNARDAMPAGGQVTLTTGSLSVAENVTIANVPPLPPGDYVAIGVTDSGTGMADEIKEHLFEPFFTTKQGEHVSGLGLATSYSIVRQSGGDIAVESELGRGTTFTIYLPKVAAPPPVPSRKSSSKDLPGGTETVLVLEDDLGVRHLSVRVLRNLGYDVIEAANSDDAQHLVARDMTRRIDLLLTDMIMPQMSGRRFADWLHITSPDTKVLFISGYLEESLHPGDQRDHETFFLQKPFDAEQLALKVREALDAES
jgi:PAS domain S-box-containing protein